MSKRVLIAICVGFLLIGISGCGKEELSEENAALISEYAANVVIKYDSEYKDKKLSDTTESTEEEATTEGAALQTTETATTEVSGGTGANQSGGAGTSEQVSQTTVDISNLFETENLSVVYDSYEVADSYEKGATFLDAEKNSQLIIAHFNITNQGNDNIKMSFLDKDIIYELAFNEEQWAKPMLTILGDDLSTYSGNIKPGKTRKVVLLFEVDKSLISSMNSLELKASYHGLTDVITMR